MAHELFFDLISDRPASWSFATLHTEHQIVGELGPMGKSEEETYSCM